jgi:hypothetical protein
MVQPPLSSLASLLQLKPKTFMKKKMQIIAKVGPDGSKTSSLMEQQLLQRNSMGTKKNFLKAKLLSDL